MTDLFHLSFFHIFFINKKLKLKGNPAFNLILIMKTFLFCFLILCCPIFAKPVFAGSSDIVILEIMIGEDGAADNEYVKLFNSSEADIILDNFALKKKTQNGTESSLVSASKFKGVIKAHGSFIIANPDYKNFQSDLVYSSLSYYISADNTIILQDAEGKVLDKVGFGKAGDFENAPAIGIENGQVLTRRVEDGLYVDTDNNQADFELNSMQENAAQTATSTEMIVEEGSVSAGGSAYISPSKDILISEIFPDPAGSDSEKEFIELFNRGSDAIDLSGWRLGDSSGYEYELSGTVYPKEYLVIYRKESRIALNNSKDEIKLFQPEKMKPLQTVKFEKAKEGESFNFYKNKFVWNKAVTPGKENVINIAPVPDFYFEDDILSGVPVFFDSSDVFDENGDRLEFSWDFGDGATSSLENPEHTFWRAGTCKVKLVVSDGKEEALLEKTIRIKSNAGEKVKKEKAVETKKPVKKAAVKKVAKKSSAKAKRANYVAVSLGAIKEQEAGDTVMIKGIVASEPGKLGAQIFYITEKDNSCGVQVYNFKKDFPKLRVGDYVEVRGELSKINDEWRVKTKDKSAIKILGAENEPEPQEMKIEEIENFGNVIKIEGEVVRKSGASVYIEDDTGEALAYFKAVDNKSIKEGDKISLAGIVGSAKSGIRILPRSDNDIEKQEAEGVKEMISGNELKIPARDEKKEFWKYFWTIMIGGVIVGGVLWFRWKKK